MSELFIYRVPPFLKTFLEKSKWEIYESMDNFRFVSDEKGQTITITESIESDGKRWRHLSLHCWRKLPSYEDLKAVKELFLGIESKVVLVILPTPIEYIYTDPRTIHLFQCLGTDSLPDFTRGGGTL